MENTTQTTSAGFVKASDMKGKCKESVCMGGVEAELLSLVTSVLYGVVWSASRPGRFTRCTN